MQGVIERCGFEQSQLATLLLPWLISRAARWLRAWI
jgi:hypothetical protein